MIKSCVLIYALIINSFSVGEIPADQNFLDLINCIKVLPTECLSYSNLLIENFEEDNLETAFKIMWCESRGKAKAYRYEDNASGLFQFIPRTYAWVQQKHNLPYWDYPIGTTYAQFIPKYNIKAAALLVEDMHSYSPYWKDFSSSEWCWGNTDKFLKLVAKEKGL